MSSLTINAPFYYKCVHAVVNWFFNTFYDFSASGTQHIPPTESLIFAANHVSFYDPPAVGVPLQRQLNYFARDTLFKGILGVFIRSMDTIPVNRNATSVKSLKLIFKVLKNKGAILIFPEGTRSYDGTLTEAKSGTGMIACKSGAKVIPTRIYGTLEVFGRHKKLPSLSGSIHVCFGTPMSASDFDPGKEHPERYKEASNRIMNEIAKLKAPEPIIV